jgi:hypothetical protein
VLEGAALGVEAIVGGVPPREATTAARSAAMTSALAEAWATRRRLMARVGVTATNLAAHVRAASKERERAARRTIVVHRHAATSSAAPVRAASTTRAHAAPKTIVALRAESTNGRSASEITRLGRR